MRQRFGDHSRVPLSRGPLGLELAVCAGRHCVSGTQSLAIPFVTRAVSRSVVVHLPEEHGSTYRVGRRTLCSSPGVAVLLAPGHEYSVTSAQSSSLNGLIVDGELLASEINDIAPSSAGTWSLRSIELPLSPVQRAEFKNLARRHAGAVSAAGCTMEFAALVQVEREVAHWLAASIARCGAVKPLSTSSRRAAEVVETWIGRHAAQVISLEQLAEVAGVSARTLQKACLTRWGHTPLELVAARRLELVRAELTSPARASSVTAAAVRAGFTHLGRFAALYRRAYGESPSETLVQARQTRTPAVQDVDEA